MAGCKLSNEGIIYLFIYLFICLEEWFLDFWGQEVGKMKLCITFYKHVTTPNSYMSQQCENTDYSLQQLCSISSTIKW